MQPCGHLYISDTFRPRDAVWVSTLPRRLCPRVCVCVRVLQAVAIGCVPVHHGPKRPVQMEPSVSLLHQPPAICVLRAASSEVRPRGMKSRVSPCTTHVSCVILRMCMAFTQPRSSTCLLLVSLGWTLHCRARDMCVCVCAVCPTGASSVNPRTGHLPQK